MPFDLIWRRPSCMLLPGNSLTAIIVSPASFFLDKEGVIPAMPVGAMTEKQMEIRQTKVMP